MTWMKNFHEKIQPIIPYLILAALIYLGTNAILGARRSDEFRRTLDRTVELTDEIGTAIGDIVRGLSELESGIGGVEEGIDDLNRELEATYRRLAELSLIVGDASTEIGITSDRAYRIARELEKRLQEGDSN